MLREFGSMCLWIAIAAVAMLLASFIVVSTSHAADVASAGTIGLTLQSSGSGATIVVSGSDAIYARPFVQATADPGIFLMYAPRGDGRVHCYMIQISEQAEGAAPTPAPPLNPPGPVTPPAPSLPLAELQLLATTGSTLPAAEAAALAASYDALAAQLGTTISSVEQLALATRVQQLAVLAAPGRLMAWQPWIAAVGNWINTQQKTGKIAPDVLTPYYGDIYRTIAKALRTQPVASQAPASRPQCNCPDGRCPLSDAPTKQIPTDSPPRRYRR
jgi:hypothetical protein